MPVRKSHLRLIAIVAGLVAAFGAGVWWPMSHQIKKHRARIAEAEAELGITRGRTDGLAQLARQVDRLRAQVAMNNKVIPNHAEMAGILRELSLHIEALELTGQGITTLEMQDRDEVIVLPVELTFRGESEAVFAFVRRVERMRRMVQIDSLEIVRRPGESRQVDALVRLRTFFSPDEAGET
jgi:Tfp pilus assembly protein PilO